MAQSPRYAPIIDWLDNERQMQLNGSSSTGSNPLFDNPVFSMLTATVARLNQNLEEGINANLNYGYDHIDRHNKLNDELQQTRNNAIISK